MNTRVPLRQIGPTALCMFLLYPCCAAQISQTSTEDRNRDISATLLSLERSKFNAQQRKDSAALNAIFDEALMWVSQDGRLLTKASYLESLHNSATIQLRAVPESLAVRVFGSIAVVVGTYEEKGASGGQPYRRRCRFIDTWTFKKGKWVCIAVTATSAIS